MVTAVEFLEVQFCDALGFMRPTAYEAVMERVAGQGHVLGFKVLGGADLKNPTLSRLNSSPAQKA